MISTAWKYSKLPKGSLRFPVDIHGGILGRQLAPDEDAEKRLKSREMDWEFFTYLYNEKLKKLLFTDNEALLYVINYVDKPDILYLTCWHGDNNPQCHAKLLKQFVEDYCKNKEQGIK